MKDTNSNRRVDPIAEHAGERASKSQEKPSARLLHQVLPYLWLVLGILILVAIILYIIEPEAQYGGPVGYWVTRILFGVFGYGTYALPAVLISLAALWRRSVDERSLPLRLILTAVTVIVLSSFVHILAICRTEVKFDFGWLFLSGADLHGGGVLGGLLAQAMYSSLQFVLSVILSVAALLLLGMFLCGVTPVYVWTAIRFRIRRGLDRRAVRRAETKEERKKEKQAAEQKARETAVVSQVPAAGEKRGKQNRPVLFLDPDDVSGVQRTEDGDVLPVLTDESLRHYTPTQKNVEEPLNVDVVMKSDAMQEELNLSAMPDAFRPVPKPTGIAFFQNAAEEEAFPEPTPPPEKTSEPDPEIVAEAEFDDFAEDEDRQIRDMFGGVTVSKAPSEAEECLPADEEENESRVPEEPKHGYTFPPVDLLAMAEHSAEVSEEEIGRSMQTLQRTLESFHIHIQEMHYACGPTVTRYEIRPEAGVRVRQVANLVDDIALGLAKSGVRIEAPIPGKAAIGIEVPNDDRETVYLRSLIESPEFRESKHKLPACLGADISGKMVCFDLAKMPHLLIAGATGMGKSVCINGIVISLLYQMSPADVRLIMVDPKQVEFVPYKDIPHLFVPIITDPKAATAALYAAVQEMEDRFTKIKDVGVRDIRGYNEIAAMDPDLEKMPYIVIIIDELADLMMTAAQEAEDSICRLTAKARAAGIHLIIGTQRPSVDVIKGTIKSNIPSRIACTVASQVDSKTILDYAGAEKLIGKGDMLYAPVGAMKPIRVQGSFVSDKEVERVCDFVKFNNDLVKYDEQFMLRMTEALARIGAKKNEGIETDGEDAVSNPLGGEDKVQDALTVILDMNRASTSLLQRKLQIGYGRAAKILDRLEEMGIIGPQDGSKARSILVSKQDYMEYYANHGCYPGFENGSPDLDE